MSKIISVNGALTPYGRQLERERIAKSDDPKNGAPYNRASNASRLTPREAVSESDYARRLTDVLNAIEDRQRRLVVLNGRLQSDVTVMRDRQLQLRLSAEADEQQAELNALYDELARLRRGAPTSLAKSNAEIIRDVSPLGWTGALGGHAMRTNRRSASTLSKADLAKAERELANQTQLTGYRYNADGDDDPNSRLYF